MSAAAVTPSTPAAAGDRARMRDLAERRFRESTELPPRFFDAHADAISRACLAMARRFQRGGRLLVFGEGSAATDAQHVSVEFVHPVLVGKRALPAIALASDVAALSAAASSAPLADAFAHALAVLGREADVAMGIATSAPSPAVRRALARARRAGMLTLALAGGDPDGEATRPEAQEADFVFVVPSSDPLLVQEVQETLYHVLWELVHVFLEHEVGG